MVRAGTSSLWLLGLLVCAGAIVPSIAADNPVDARLDEPSANETPDPDENRSPGDNDTASTEAQADLVTGPGSGPSQAVRTTPDGGGGGLDLGWTVAIGMAGLAAVGASGALRTRRRGGDDPQDPRRARENPGPEGAMILGKQSLDEEDVEAAEAWFRTARELDPSSSIAAMCQGLCQIEMGNPSRARDLLSQAVSQDLGNGTARYHLARAQALDGDVEEAARTIQPLVDVRPDVVEDLLEDPDLHALRDDPRWLAALGELG